MFIRDDLIGLRSSQLKLNKLACLKKKIEAVNAQTPPVRAGFEFGAWGA
jgi:hypothetical protein